MTHIIISEWAQYALYRTKHLMVSDLPCGLGRLLEQLSQYTSASPFAITLVINGLTAQDHHYHTLQSRYHMIEHIIARPNIGQDFGAYNAGYQHLKSLGYEGAVMFLNTGVTGPYQTNWLQTYHQLFDRYQTLGVCGQTLSALNTRTDDNDFLPHVQSYCMMTTMPILNRVFPSALPGANCSNRDDIVRDGEIGFSQRILNAGYGISCTQYPEFYYTNGSDWTIPKREGRFRLSTPHFVSYQL